MSYTSFDCTQLITLNTQERNSVANIKKAFEQLGFIVITNNQIAQNKLNYFKCYLNSTIIEYSTIIELVDKEFIGEFEDWKDVSNPPVRITEFMDKLNEILKDKNIKDLKLIIVSSASEDKKEDNILQLLSSKKDLSVNLFSMSTWNFNLKTDILILKLV